MLHQLNGSFLFVGHERLFRIAAFVECSMATKPGHRACCANVFQNYFIAGERFTGPVCADEAKHSMLNQIPLGGTWRKMSNGNRQSELVCKSLQSDFPSPDSWSVSASAITFNQQAIRSFVFVSSNGHPPRTNGFDDERGCFSRNTHDNKAFVVFNVVDAQWNCSSVRPTRKVMVKHVSGMTPPSASGVFEVAQEFLFLAINADNRPFFALKAPPPPCEKAKLLIPIGVVRFRQSLAVGPQRVLHLVQQPTNGRMTDGDSSSVQSSREIASCLVCPTQTTHRVARCRVLEQLFQHVFDVRAFFSINFRPPPARRIRSNSAGCDSSHSRSPRRIVMRDSPVISRMRCMPPRPSCLASKPANSRRLRSSSSRITWLIERWYSATSGCCRDLHSRHEHRWNCFGLRSAMIDLPILGW